MPEERRSVIEDAASAAVNIDANIRDGMSAMANHPGPIYNVYSGVTFLFGVEQVATGKVGYAAIAFTGSVALRKWGQRMDRIMSSQDESQLELDNRGEI